MTEAILETIYVPAANRFDFKTGRERMTNQDYIATPGGEYLTLRNVDTNTIKLRI